MHNWNWWVKNSNKIILEVDFSVIMKTHTKQNKTNKNIYTAKTKINSTIKATKQILLSGIE